MKLKNVPNVCVNNVFVNAEDLPLPYVHYPPICGPFIGFSETADSQIFFCSCYKNTLSNFAILREQEMDSDRKRGARHIDSTRDHFLGRYFPGDFVLDFVNKSIKIDKTNIFQYICFKDNTCHICNKKQPEIQSCYAGTSSFEAKMCWYVKKEYFDNGIGMGRILPQVCPETIYRIREEALYFIDMASKYREASDYSNETIAYSKGEKLARKWHNIIENNVRKKIGYPLIGEKWKNETRLFTLIKEVFGEQDVIHHYRADFLEGLEFDIFIKSKNIAVEYQGIQHFYPQRQWGGKKGFQKTILRDERKKKLCNNHGISLIYFTYKDFITKELVYERLANWINI